MTDGSFNTEFNAQISLGKSQCVPQWFTYPAQAHLASQVEPLLELSAWTDC